MAANNIKGITIEIGGNTTALDKALKDVNKQTRSLQAELRDVDKLLKLDPKNTELLAQKQKILSESISATSEKLDTLKKAEEQVQQQFERGEVSEQQYRALQREIIKTSEELDSLKEASKQAEKAMEGLQGASELTGKELDEAKEKSNEFKESISSAADAITKAGAVAGSALVAAATYATKFETDCDKAFNTLVTQTGAADDELEGLEDSLMNIYKNNFGENIEDIAVAMATVKQQTGLANDELESTTETALLMRDTFDIDVNEGVRGVTAMMKQFGISAQEAYNLMAQGAQKGLNQNGDLADQMAEYAVYYADMGFSAQEMFNMISNGAKDGTFQIDYLNDAVKEFGIRVKDGTADDTFKELGLDVDDLKSKFTAGGDGAREAFTIVNDALFSCEDQVQRNILGVTLYGTKWEDLGEDAIRSLINTQGEISNTTDALSKINEQKYDDIGSQIEGLGRNINAELAKPIGEELQPVISNVISEVQSKLPDVRNILLNVISKVTEFVSFVAKNGTTIISIIAGIAAGMLAWNVVNMIQGLIAAIKVWKATTEGVTIAQKILNTVMAANPIGIIITLVATLVAALVTLFATNEDFRNKVIAVWEQVKETALNAFGAIADFFTVTIPAAFNSVVNFVKSNWQGLLLLIVNPFAGAFKLLYDNCEGFRNTINTLIENIKAYFSGLWENIVLIFQNVGQWFSDRFTEAYTAITTVFSGIGQWFSARWTDVKTALSTVGSWFLTTFQTAYTNVTNVFRGIGQWFSARWTDVKTALSTVGSWFLTTFQTAYTNVTNVFRGIGQWFSARWTDVKNALSSVGTWFQSTFQTAYNNVTNIFKNIGSWFKTNVIDKIKSVFDGFSLADTGKKIMDSFVNAIKSIHIPKLSIDWGTAEKTIAGLTIKVPVPHISWNALGGIMRNPTIFGMLGGKLQGGGEAGDEAILPLDIFYRRTEGYIDDAIARATAAAKGSSDSSRSRGDFIQNINIESPDPLSPYEVARQTRNQTRNLVLQLQGGR